MTWSGCGTRSSRARLRREPSAGPVPGREAGGAAGGRRRLDEISEMVAAWPLERAEAVAHAFTVYFHLANLAEEHQRIRTLRERDAGGRAGQRESLAAAVQAIRDRPAGRARHRAAGRTCGCTRS